MNRTSAFVAAVALAVFGGEAAAQTGNTFVVNSTGNEPDHSIGNGACATAAGACTLRAALQEANATPEADTIVFAIGAGPQRINVPAALPALTSPVSIDGWTQPGFTGAPLIEVRGSLAAGTGFQILAGNSTVRGLIINSFGGDGILLEGGGNNVVEGSYIGLDAAGLAAEPNLGAGVRITSNDNRIGGTDPSRRNVISGNSGFLIEGGITIHGLNAVRNIVQGNIIGLDAAGLNPVPNLGRGVAIHRASNNLIGGSEPGAGNLISGNRATGIRIMSNSTGNLVQRNYIGINRLGETRWGVWPQPGVLSNARGVQIRGDRNYVVENVLAGNSFDGLFFFDGKGFDVVPQGFPSENLVYGNYIFGNGRNGIGVYVGARNTFLANAIFNNAMLGINLADAEEELVTVNDAGDADAGGNDLQNHPTLASATVTGGQTRVSGVLETAPDGTYAVDLYANQACSVHGHGEGRYLVGRAMVTTDAAGAGAFEAVLPFVIPKGWFIAAAATSPDGSTSEFSACTPVQ